MRRLIRWPVLALVAAGLVTACVPVYYGPDWSVYADVPPPAPYAEVIPPAPGPDYLWVNGYWNWNGATYVWVRGYWGLRPYPGYVWLHSGWELRHNRYVFVPGRWARPGHPRVRYVHPIPRVQHGNTYRTVPQHQARPAQRSQPRGHPARPAR